MIQFKKLSKSALLPTRQTEGAAGFDIHAAIDDPVKLVTGRHVIIDTNIAVAIPTNCVGLIKPRSGWAVKNGIDTMAGVVDADYRGEIKVILTKHTSGEFWVNPNDRIAQLVVVPFVSASEEVDELQDTIRGEGGFGSTGM